MDYKVSVLLLTLFSITLFACSPLDTDNPKSAMCRQLKANIIFGGGTSNTRQADIEKAEKPLQRSTYDSNC